VQTGCVISLAYYLPFLKQDVEAIEKVQRRFTERLRGLNNFICSARLRLPC